MRELLAQPVRATAGFEALMNNSYLIRREVETTLGGGWANSYTPYKPTNWDREDDEILDGWSEKPGTCPECFTLRSLNGSCNC